MIGINSRDYLNANKCLILIHQKKDFKWLDKTDDISFISNNYEKGKLIGYKVRFKNSNSLYSYNFNNIKIYENPTEIDISNKNILSNGNNVIGAKKVLKFGSNLYKIFYLNNKIELTDNIKIINQDLNSNKEIFKYYKELAEYAAQNSEDEKSVDEFLFDQYKKITQINQSSILSEFIKGDKPKSFSVDNQSYIFPFKFNLSQKQAVINAFKSNVSIIEGPPGCGKTQTILNIIANIIINNKTAAIVSNNNTAIKNIEDKLIVENLSFLTAFLGNLENKKIFFEDFKKDSLKQFLNGYVYTSYMINDDKLFIEYSNKLDYLFQLSNELALKKIQLDNLELEYDHFKKEGSLFDINVFKKFNCRLPSNQYIKLKVNIEHIKKITLFHILKWKLKYKISRKIIKDNLNELLIWLENQYYIKKLEELRKDINKIENTLIKDDIKTIEKEYLEKSKIYFKNILCKKYKNIKDINFSIDSYKSNFNEFVNRFPIILSTTYSLIGSINNNYMFDYLIIDEASQSDLLSSVLAMSCAKRIIVVGDSKQLPQIENISIYDKAKALESKFNIEDKYSYIDNSILSSVNEVFPNAKKQLLREHYRCHPKIINFCNEKFYDGQLIIMTNDNVESPFYICKTVEGNFARKDPIRPGQYNLREIDEMGLLLESIQNDDIGIISPFRLQIEKISERFKNNPNIEVDTIHKFQGRQKDFIILSTVLNDLEVEKDRHNRLYDFVNNAKLLNVAISRSAKKLILVVSDKIYKSKNNHIRDLIKYIEYCSDINVYHEGKVVSVFDIMYSDYKNELLEYNRKNKSKLIISEKRVLDLIDVILKDYKDYKVAMHITLNKLVKNISCFKEDEIKYLNHPLAHVDFLIYNKITKEPVLVIEVDGIKYHDQNIKQTLRDSIKDEALKVNGIPILRLKTNESREDERIRNELNKTN